MIKVNLDAALYMYYWLKGVWINVGQKGWLIGDVFSSSLLSIL